MNNRRNCNYAEIVKTRLKKFVVLLFLIAYSNVPMLITDTFNTDYMKEQRCFGFI